LGAVVFHAVLASTSGWIVHPLGQFLLSIGIGAAGAVIGAAVLWLCLCKLDLDDLLSTTSQLACVVGVAAVCDIVREDAGLIAAILMGLAVANLRAFDVPAKRPFFETLVQLIIGVLDLARAFQTADLDVLMWAPSEDQRDQIKQANLELAPGEQLASAVGEGTELEGVTAILLLTDEDHFNALAATTLAGNSETPVYRLAPSHGTVPPTLRAKRSSPLPSPARP
jgi:hypothetical protein